MLTFVETPVFTRRVIALLPDVQYGALQWTLGMAPNRGAVIPGSGGLRIIYYWHKPADVIYLLLVFEKTRRVDLTPDERRALARLMREELA